MKLIFFFILFVVFTTVACSDLDISKLSCNTNNECTSDSICNKENKCSICPTDSTKDGNTCNCGIKFYDKEENKCVSQKSCIQSADCDDYSVCKNNKCFKCPSSTAKFGDFCYPYKSKCDFNDETATVVSFQTNKSCLEGKGVCYRNVPESEIGVCIADICNPRTPVIDCGTKACVFTGILFECKEKIGITGFNVGEICSASKKCKTDLTCADGKCQEFCRPNNSYEDYNTCDDTNCKDLKLIFIGEKTSSISMDTTGACYEEPPE